MRTTRKTAVKAEQKSEIVEAIKFLAKEKEISEEMLFATVEDALKKAYQKNLPKDVPVPSAANITATIGRTDGVVHVYVRRLIVEEWYDDEPGAGDQISLEEAQKIKPDCHMGDIIEIDVTPRGFLRVAAQTAKGVIMQRLRAGRSTMSMWTRRTKSSPPSSAASTRRPCTWSLAAPRASSKPAK